MSNDKLKIEDGKLYWTIHANMEAEGYGDTEPYTPYLVKAEVLQNGARYLHYYSEETGEADDDDNATVLLSSFDDSGVFLTEKEAKAGYRKALVGVIRDRLDSINDLVNEMSNSIEGDDE